MTVHGVEGDAVAPYLLTENTTVRARADGQYDVVMLFVDDLSAVK